MKPMYISIVVMLIAVALTALLLSSCSPTESPDVSVPEEAQVGQLVDWAACTFQPGRKTQFDAECGRLIVPENWDRPDSRLITLPVVRIPSTGSDPAEPVFYLQGGPGSPNLSWSPPAWLLEKHAVVMVGYRGVEGSVVLACPDLSRLLKQHLGKDMYSEEARAAYVAAAKQCAEEHQAVGVDLSGYTGPGVIEDMEAARKALGYERIHLFSESYGTRLAQLYAYQHPDSLSRLVLIGVNTPGHFVYDPAVLDGMIEHLSDLCAQDPDCSQRTDDLAQTIYAVNHAMPKRWLVFNIDPDSMRLGTHFMFFSNPNMSMILDAYLSAAEGDPSGLAMLNLMAPMMLPADQMIFGDFFNKGGTLDLEKYQGIESIRLGDSIMGAPLAEMIWPMAVEWPIELVPAELRAFQESDVEMLLVNGTVDFSTPPIALDEARPYFHKAQTVLLPEFSHTGDVQALQPAAFQRLITSYYDTGVADESLYVYQPVSFKPAMRLTSMAKLLVAAIVLLPLLVLGGVLLARRSRRRRAVKIHAVMN